MENDPTIPKLEASSVTLERDLEEASEQRDGDDESFVNIDRENLNDKSRSPSLDKMSTSTRSTVDIMIQSKYAQVPRSMKTYFISNHIVFVSFMTHHDDEMFEIAGCLSGNGRSLPK